MTYASASKAVSGSQAYAVALGRSVMPITFRHPSVAATTPPVGNPLHKRVRVYLR